MTSGRERHRLRQGRRGLVRPVLLVVGEREASAGLLCVTDRYAAEVGTQSLGPGHQEVRSLRKANGSELLGAAECCLVAVLWVEDLRVG